MAEEEHETPPVETPPPAHEPPVVEPPATHDDLRPIVTGLVETVNGLVQRVEQLSHAPADETPTDVPWTHRKFA